MKKLLFLFSVLLSAVGAWAQGEDMLSTPLTLEAVEAGTITFNNQAAGPVTYRVNGGEAQTIESKTTGEIELKAGDKVAFFGDNASYSESESTYSNFTCSADCYIYGNIMSLVSSSNYATADKLEGDYTFFNLFRYNTHLKNHPSYQLMLPATTLAKSCYRNMFGGCGLTKAPTLPATTLADYCYSSMFSSCMLAEAPELPATTLAQDCYNGMFSFCHGLTEAPELPATTLAGRCYASMFYYCSGLTKVPELPATRLYYTCYGNMFYNCTSLTKAPELPATTLAYNCYGGMFSGCTGLTKAPELPATTLAESCYNNMFYGCTGLTEAPELPATTLASSCYHGMFSYCRGLTEAPALPATTLAKHCYWEMFRKCASLSASPELPALFLIDGCYEQMFTGCTNLKKVTCLAIDNYASNCTKDWLDGVSSTGSFIKAVGMNDWDGGANGIPENWTVSEDATAIQDYMLQTPLTLEAIEEGEIKVKNYAESNMYYSINGDNTKHSIRKSNNATIAVKPGDRIRFYGNNKRYYNFETDYWGYPKTSSITCTADCYIYGNIMSLISSTDYATLTSLEEGYTFYSLFEGNAHIKNHPAKTLELPATTLAEYCYSNMFWGCTGLTEAPALPATTLAGSCYSSMFGGCTSLTEAPELPATTLVSGCYYNMFRGCTGLTKAPELPATTLAEYCYSNMFWGCTGLTEAPALPATTLAGSCYSRMFSGCTSLKEAPKLHATIPVDKCYSEMFSGCTHLNNITCLFAHLRAYNCTSGWLKDVAPTGTFNKLIDINWPIGEDGIPEGWDVTEVDSGIELEVDEGTPLTLEAIESGEIRIRNQSKGLTYYRINGKSFLPITNNTIIPVNVPVNAGDKVEFYGSNNTYYDENATTNGNYNISCTSDCYIYGNIMSLISSKDFSTLTTLSGSYTFYGLFQGNTHIKNHPVLKLELPAITLADSCYSRMFRGCTGLNKAPELPATTLASSCYYDMFWGCTGLTEAPELPATTLASSCYYNMFRGCTGLTKAPELPAKTLASSCYSSMFWGCTGLTEAPVLPATTLADSCYFNMFRGCTGLTNAPMLPATTLAKRCYAYMFNRCTGLNSVICLATDISAGESISGWLYGVSATGTFVKHPDMKEWPTGASGIPEGWTVVDYDMTDISATTAGTKKAPATTYDLRGMKSVGGKKGLKVVNNKIILMK